MSEKTARAGWWIALLFVISTEAAGAVPVRLIDAVKAADRDAIRTLLQQRVDVNAAEADGTTALHWAARASDLQAADMLLRAGANVKLANRYGVTPLYLASTNGNAAMIELLLKAGADPNSALPEGETALMTAARSGSADAVTTLIGRGADVNRKEAWRGQNALMWAAAEGHAEVIRALVAHGADVRARSNGGFTALLFAVREGKIGAVKTLLEAGADLNESLPVRRGGGPAAADRLQANEDATTPLLAAAGVGTNSAEEEPGTEAEILEAVKLVMAHGGDVNTVDKNGNTAMHGAAHKRAPSVIRFLAQNGAKIEIWNQPNSAKQTPLQVAEGVRVGLNFRSHAPSAEAIREVLAAAGKRE